MSNDSEIDLSRSFWVARVPEAVFSNDPEVSLKPEFEGVFKAYDEYVQFKYLKSFGRVCVIYSCSEIAELAQSNLHNHEFQGTNLKVQPVKPITIGSQTLDLPPLTKQFLISPPASPPVGWEQSDESAPCEPCVVDFSLVTALANLQIPGETQELIGATESNPSIVLVAPEDTSEDTLLPTVLRGEQSQQQQQPIRMSALPRSQVQTHRPPLPESK